MEKITFSFGDEALKDELREIIGTDPSHIQISTRLYEYKPLNRDVVVAHSREHNSPLIVYRDGKFIYNFDISLARQFSFTDSKRPIYTYLPFFNIRKIAPAIRRPISNLMASQRRAFRSPEDALAHYRILPLNANDFITIVLNRVNCRYLKTDKPMYEWPENKKAAFVSLHDVDSDGLSTRRKSDPLLSIENKHGIKGTWFFLTTVLDRIRVDDLSFLKDDGHEVGWHGYNHDHRLPFGRFTQNRIRHLNQSILVRAENSPLGMRTPKLLKTKHLFDILETNCPAMCYDTSFLDGIVPYYISNEAVKHRILEIPTTVPTDIKLYIELANLPSQTRYETILNVQIERTKRLIETGALISITTHPEVDITERPELLEVYDKYISYLRDRDDIWFATAGSIYKYWKEAQPNGG